MVTFEIRHPDFNNETSVISLYFEKFLVGSNNRCQLRFPATENTIYLKATQKSDKFIVESLDDHFFILNGKKYKGTIKCQEGDIIKLGLAEITIVKINLSETYREINFTQAHEKFLKNHRELTQVMEALESELIFSDSK